MVFGFLLTFKSETIWVSTKHWDLVILVSQVPNGIWRIQNRNPFITTLDKSRVTIFTITSNLWKSRASIRSPPWHKATFFIGGWCHTWPFGLSQCLLSSAYSRTFFFSQSKRLNHSRVRTLSVFFWHIRICLRTDNVSNYKFLPHKKTRLVGRDW